MEGILMKIRVGFVSNSSTSSYICIKCGEIEVGQDASLSDFDMFSCENGHALHKQCCGLPKEVIEMLEYPDHDGILEYIDEFEGNERNQMEILKRKYIASGDDYGIMLSEEGCLVCQMQILEKDAILDYLIKHGDLNMDAVKTLINREFLKYIDFLKWVNAR
jgi:hypothetical protein